MRKRERDRLKVVVYEAYMAGQARGEKTEEILDALSQKFDRTPRQIQNWMYDVDKQRKATQQHVEELRSGDSRKPSTVEEIVIEEERKQAVLKHQDDLRAVAGRWKSEVWLPPPWQWDIAHLEFVFYVDTEKLGRGEGGTGYKLPSDLAGSEESKGHVRSFAESSRSVTWNVLPNGSIVLNLPVEQEASFGHLNSHSRRSPAWGLFAEWKEKGGTYIQLCSSLLTRIEQDAEKAIGAKFGLSWWSIYHDAFCTEDTLLRCRLCGTQNSDAFICPICGGKFSHEEEIKRHQGDNHLNDPKGWLFPHCQNCRSPLGWLRSLPREYQVAVNNQQSASIAGWNGIEQSIEVERSESYTRGHADLRDKYRGCDLVGPILEAEKEVKQVQVRLISEVTNLSDQKVFPGKCPACRHY